MTASKRLMNFAMRKNKRPDLGGIGKIVPDVFNGRSEIISPDSLRIAGRYNVIMQGRTTSRRYWNKPGYWVRNLIGRNAHRAQVAYVFDSKPVGRIKQDGITA